MIFHYVCPVFFAGAIDWCWGGKKKKKKTQKKHRWRVAMAPKPVDNRAIDNPPSACEQAAVDRAGVRAAMAAQF